MKVLIIQVKMIGDVLTTSILAEKIKKKYKKAQVHYLVNSNTFPVVENNPWIDVYKIINPEISSNKSIFLNLIKYVRNQKFDVVIDVYSKISTGIITLLSAAKIRISKYKFYTSFMYTHTHKEPQFGETNYGLALENRHKLLTSLGINSSEIFKPKIYLTNKEIKSAKSLLLAKMIDFNKPIYMISVLGSSKSKTYPSKYMVIVLDFIIKIRPEAQILFNYIPNQKNDAKSIFDSCQEKTKKRIFFQVFGENIRQFLAITKLSNKLIGNEGGAVNMAKALQVQTFTIFSPWIQKEHWSLYENKNINVSVHLKDYKPKIFKNITKKKLRSNYSFFYNEFHPNLFIEQLKEFIEN